MQDQAEPSIDEVLKDIRSAILEKERKEYFKQFWPEKSRDKKDEEVFELSSSMLVKREDIPYELGLWTFDDVARKIMKKYRLFFEKRFNEAAAPEEQKTDDVRVSVKEDK
ncbi:MAG: hypothetical protein IKO06_01340 [Alphaproteobacteria bacterium]|nr:hypothetical protein [Alphaproteobacteria bacterium]